MIGYARLLGAAALSKFQTPAMRKRLLFLSVVLYFALMSVYAVASAYRTLTWDSRVHPDVRGWSFVPGERPKHVNNIREDAACLDERGTAQVNSVGKDGPAASLRTGDVVIALGDQPVKNCAQALDFFGRVKPGSLYTITVMRDGRRETFTLLTASMPLYWWMKWVLLGLLLPAIYISTGLVLFLLKPFDKQVLLLALLFGTAAPWFPGIYGPWWLAVVILVGFIIHNAVYFPLFVHFCLNLLTPSPLLRRYPRLEWYIYLLFLSVAVPPLMILAFFGLTDSLRFHLLYALYTILLSFYLIGGLMSLILRYRHLSQVERRKVRLVSVAFFVGVVPYLTHALLGLFDYLNGPLGLSATQWGWLRFLRSTGFLFMPPAWTYAIMRHQVIPVSLVIRRGVQYLLAKNALRVLLLLPVAGLVLSVAFDPRRPADILLRNSTYFYALAIAALAPALVFRRRLYNWIDRKFFREQYDSEKILHDLIEEVRQADSLDDTARLVGDKVNSALHPECLYLFYREEDGRDLLLGYSSGDGPDGGVRIPEEFKLLRYVERRGGAQSCPLPRGAALPPPEEEWLLSIGTKLIVPMLDTDARLAGLLLLGGKKSEVPYTAGDRALLETLADQIAIVYENARLKESVRRGRRVEHEVLARLDARSLNLLKECPACGACFDGSAQLCAIDGAELRLTLPVDRTVAGRYRLERLLGRGGMGAVYEASDLRLRRRVAVKFLLGGAFGNEAALRRFEREARTCASLSHPNIIAVYDYGTLDTGGAYLVMELVRGETLAAAVERRGCLHPRVAAEYFAQIIEGVKAAHTAGVIHRDLKPENVLLDEAEDGRTVVKLLDFGLAKILEPVASSGASPAGLITAPGAVIGTIGYMSVEQLTGGAVDERSDLFAVGVMVFKALTGRCPFGGATYHELLANIERGDFRLPGDTPAAWRLDAVLRKCLAKDPRDRFASAAEMQAELVPAIRDYSNALPPESECAEADTLVRE
jgi:hypothetical protein